MTQDWESRSRGIDVDATTPPPNAPAERRVRRRTLLAAGAGVAAAALAGTGPLGALAAQRLGEGRGLAAALHLAAQELDLPEDAAPAEGQVFIVPSDPTSTFLMDFFEAVYGRPSYASDLFSDPLVRIDKNFQIIPAAATAWSGSDDGKSWTFTIDPELVWSDGNPVTAADWVTTFQYAADPEHAWDFTWYFDGVIKNWGKAIKGEVPFDQIGVKQGADDRTLIFDTEVAAPYLPAMLLYSLPLSKAALETHGPLYNSEPETCVSSGPFRLGEWQKDQRIVYIRNDSYKGKLVVPIQRVIVKLAAPDSHFSLYENDEVDFLESPAPANLKIAQAEFPEQIYSSVGDFRTFYLFFDVTKAPFDNLKVRQAFSHVVDRDAIKAAILGPEGSPAYSWLAPGFPASNQEGLREIQAYDPELGRTLLAEAGFPGGEGFPQQELWLRAPRPLDVAIAGSIAAMLKQELGVDVAVSNKDQTLFMDALTSEPTEILFGYVSYGMDFLDPFNMLSVWLTTGRHSWASADFDAKVAEAASFLGPTTERLAKFEEAERVLVEDVPGVFVYHETPVQLIKPWLRGDALTADENGNTSIHWPRYTTMSTVPGGLYVGGDAPTGREE